MERQRDSTSQTKVLCLRKLPAFRGVAWRQYDCAIRQVQILQRGLLRYLRFARDFMLIRRQHRAPDPGTVTPGPLARARPDGREPTASCGGLIATASS